MWKTHYFNGVALIEVLLTVGLISILSAAVIPSSRNYNIRSDLQLAVEQTQ